MSERDDVLRELRARARYYASLSSLGVPAAWTESLVPEPPAPAASRPPALAASTRRAAAPSAPPAPQSLLGAAPPPPDAPDLNGLDAPQALQAVRDWIGDCQRCKLAAGRKSIVFGQGHPQARLMFVGEAPGADEDVQGLAFVGRAGQLLTDIIEKGLKLPRAEVYICNVIKCRPPGNRNPEPDEILACQPFLERQILSVRPRLIVGLGKFACQFLLKTAEPITRLRGKMGSYLGIDVMPTYHPAYLLRNPGAKRDVWEDMKVVLQRLRD